VARGVTEANLKGENAQFINPKVFAERVAAGSKFGAEKALQN